MYTFTLDEWTMDYLKYQPLQALFYLTITITVVSGAAHPHTTPITSITNRSH